MSYLGEKPAQTLAAPTSQYFNGDGSTVAFTLNRAVNVAEDLDVFVNNVRQEPGVGKSYTATGTTLTFDAAPSSGTANVYVVYRGLAEVTTRLEHDPNAALAATTGTFSSDLTVDTNTLYVDSTNNRVGVGTASPSYKLHSTTSDGSDSAGYFYNTAGSGNGTSLVARGGANNPTPNFQVQDYNGNADLTVTGVGKVGIGTASPPQRFVVSNAGADNIVMCENSSASIQMFMQAQSGVGAVGTLTNHDTILLSNNTERLRINSSGNVGIGTSPSYLLHVDGVIGGKAVEIGRTGGAGHQDGSHFYLSSDLQDPNGPTFTNANYRFFSNRTGSVLAMNGNAGGYFYEGTNDDSSSASRRFGVESDGDVRNTNNSYGSLSDQSIKQDIADASSQWEDIKNLQVRKFRLIADVEADVDAPYHLGLVAQEVETVSPGLVKVEVQRDALKDAEGNPILDDNGELQMQETGELKAIKYSILYMKAVKALQEAMNRIETLEENQIALEARIAALENA